MQIRKVSHFIFLGIFMVFTLVQVTQASWVNVGDAVNVDPDENAFQPSMMGRNDTPYITFSEMTGNTRQVYVKHWNGSDWEQDGGSVNMDTNVHAFEPSIGSVGGGSPFVAWRENESPYKVYVKSFNGTSWAQVGASYLNVDSVREAKTPHLLAVGNNPYVVWDEYATSTARRVWVKYWNGTWNQQGTYLNVVASMATPNPRLAVYNGTPWVTWQEYSSTINGYIWVKYWNGSAWERVGDTGVHFDHTKDPKNPRIAFQGSTPFVGWKERSDSGSNPFQFYVKYWNGSSWIQAGDSLLIDEEADFSWSDLVASHGNIYACWAEDNSSGYKMYVKVWNGTQWNLVGSNIGLIGSVDTYYSSLADVAGTLYASFQNGDTGRIHVKKYLTATPYIPPISSPTPTVTPTGTLTEGDLNSKKVLAYPVPATDQVRFLMDMDASRKVSIHIYNSAAEQVAQLSEQLPSGAGQAMVWSCGDVGPGIYYVRVMMDDEEVQKLKVVVTP